MTEEQATKLIELMEDYQRSMDEGIPFVAIMIGIALLMGVAMIIWELYRLKQVKKIKDEYYSTLTDEQKKAVAQWREINK